MEPSKVALPATTEDGNSPFPENKMKVEGLLHTSDIKFDPTKFIKSDPFETIKLRYDEASPKLQSAKELQTSATNSSLYALKILPNGSLLSHLPNNNIFPYEIAKERNVDTVLKSPDLSNNKKRKRAEEIPASHKTSRLPLQSRDNKLSPSELEKLSYLDTVATSSPRDMSTPSETSIQPLKPKALPLTPLLGAIELNPIRSSGRSEGVEIITKRIVNKEVSLYVGSAAVAANYGWLKEKEIGCIVNVTKEIRNYYETTGKFRYFKIPVIDGIDEPLIEEHLDAVCHLISDSFLNGVSVLVHCNAGQSRSIAIVIGYLLQCERYTLEHALNLLTQKRIEMKINEGFKKQLTELEFRIYGVVTYNFFEIGVRRRKPPQKFGQSIIIKRHNRKKTKKLSNNYKSQRLTMDSFVIRQTQNEVSSHHRVNTETARSLKSNTSFDSVSQKISNHNQQFSSLHMPRSSFSNDSVAQELVVPLEEPSS